MAKKLKTSQKMFVKEYIKNGGNATKAIKTIQPDISSDKYATVKGCRMIANDSVKKEIKRKLGEISLEEIRQKIIDIVDDDTTRKSDKLKGLDMLVKCKGGYAPEKLEIKQVDTASLVQQSRVRRERLLKQMQDNK